MDAIGNQAQVHPARQQGRPIGRGYLELTGYHTAVVL
jgi:hypothetical protein